MATMNERTLSDHIRRLQHLTECIERGIEMPDVLKMPGGVWAKRHKVSYVLVTDPRELDE